MLIPDLDLRGGWPGVPGLRIEAEEADVLGQIPGSRPGRSGVPADPGAAEVCQFPRFAARMPLVASK